MRFPGSVFVSSVLLSWLTATNLVLAQGGPAPPPPVTVAKPLVKDIVEQDDFIGRFEAIDQVDIRSRVSGYLDKVHFQDGTFVKAGDLLFTIDPRPYRNSLEQAQSAVTSEGSALESSVGDTSLATTLVASAAVGQNADTALGMAISASGREFAPQAPSVSYFVLPTAGSSQATGLATAAVSVTAPITVGPSDAADAFALRACPWTVHAWS